MQQMDKKKSGQNNGEKKTLSCTSDECKNEQKISGTNNEKKKITFLHLPGASLLDVSMFVYFCQKVVLFPCPLLEQQKTWSKQNKNIQTNQSNKFINTFVFLLYFPCIS